MAPGGCVVARLVWWFPEEIEINVLNDQVETQDLLLGDKLYFELLSRDRHSPFPPKFRGPDCCYLL